MLVDGDNGIADDIRAAMEGHENPVTEVDPANETPVELPEEPPVEGEKTRERGADGKFVAKAAETEQIAPDQPSEAVADPAEKLAIRVPASWSPAAKAKFAALDPEVQQAVAKREQEIDHGLRRKSEDLKRYEPLEQLIAPHRSKWQMQGMDETTAIRTLLAAQEMLETQPEQAIAHLAKAYGVNLSAQPTPGQVQSAPQPAGNSQELLQLQQQFNALQQSIQAREAEQTSQTIAAFFADPANLYAENVRPAMAALLQAGQASDLKDAYEKAIWMDPSIRPLLQTPQVVPDKDRVARAKAAGASVTGSPAEPRSALNSNGSIDDDIRNALSELTGR